MPQRSTFEERFLAELERHPEAVDSGVTTAKLREQLGWKESSFNKTRNSLINKNLVKAAPGPGGKTKLVEPPKNPMPKRKALKAFISYSHVDEALKSSLLAHLKPLERLGQIESWSDRSIKPGDSIDEEIRRQLESADLILLLVSVDFINSKYCYEIELAKALERHRKKELRIIPIILRSCVWQHTPFGGLLALPKDGKAIKSWTDQDEAITNTVSSIHDLITEILAD